MRAILLRLPSPPLPLGWHKVLLYGWCLAIFTVSSVPHLQPPAPFVGRDKLAHIVEYSILGYLAGRSSWDRAADRRRRRLLAALAFGVGFGFFDEMHQGSVPGRSMSGWDLVADAIGVGWGLAAAWRAGRAGREAASPDLPAGTSRNLPFSADSLNLP